jgi:hypothetical protein
MPPEVAVARISRRELLVYRTHGLLTEDAPLSTETWLRIRRIRRMRRDLGLSYDVIGLIVPLVERIEALEERLARS